MIKSSLRDLNNFYKGSSIKFYNKHWILRIFIGVLIFFTFSMSLSAIIWYNDSDLTFDYIEDLKADLIKAASDFLNSYSSFLLLLSHAELGGRDLQISKKHLESSIKSMEEAVKNCKELIKNVKDPLYNEHIINDLKKFGYDTLRENNNLIVTIFESVRKNLEKGEIQKTYKKMQSDCDDILKTLKNLRGKIELGLFPEKKELWDLCQTYSKSMLAGQYVARVFGEIKKNRRINK